MQLLTQQLPSGLNYPFHAIEIKAMTFAQILEYLENVPDPNKNPVENFYFDYSVVKMDDPNIDQLLLIDLEYVIYMKKAVTIAEDLTYQSDYKCHHCGNVIPYHVSLAGIEWNKMDDELREGIDIEFKGSVRKVRMPRVHEFMDILMKYRKYKKLTDLKIIRLIALFEESKVYLSRVENDVINATYKDISTLYLLDSLYYDFVKPKTLHCQGCVELYQPSEIEIYSEKARLGIPADEDLPEDVYREIKHKKGAIEIGMKSLVSDFFRLIPINNRPSSEEILSGKIR